MSLSRLSFLGSSGSMLTKSAPLLTQVDYVNQPLVESAGVIRKIFLPSGPMLIRYDREVWESRNGQINAWEVTNGSGMCKTSKMTRESISIFIRMFRPIPIIMVPRFGSLSMKKTALEAKTSTKACAVSNKSCIELLVDFTQVYQRTYQLTIPLQ